jgi:ABC-type nitrate/sulfonate/bicarbonate transport system permease component
MHRIAWGAARLAPIAALLAAWEIFARSGAVTPFMLPAPSAVAERIYDDALGGDLFINIGVTLYRALAGFAIAAVGGVVLGTCRATRWRAGSSTPSFRLASRCRRSRFCRW